MRVTTYYTSTNDGAEVALSFHDNDKAVIAYRGGDMRHYYRTLFATDKAKCLFYQSPCLSLNEFANLIRFA